MIWELRRELYRKAKQERKPLEEDDWKAVYGKPSVRFDEGELEIGPYGYYASSLLYCYK
jgi:hypothetical protein